MSIEQLDKPCWVLHLTNDDEVHCATEEAAKQWLTPDHTDMYDRVTLAATPCFIARCNTCGETENGEEDGPMHYDTATAAQGDLGDLTATTDGQHICDWCRDKCPCTGYTPHVLGATWCACSHQAAMHTNDHRCLQRIEVTA